MPFSRLAVPRQQAPRSPAGVPGRRKNAPRNATAARHWRQLAFSSGYMNQLPI